MPAPLAPHTARSSRAPCVRRPSAGGWSCGCTWCPTRGRCPTRSGSACPQGRGPRGSPRIPPPGCLPLAASRSPPSLPIQGPIPSGGATGPFGALVSFRRGQAQHPCGWGMGRLPSVCITQVKGPPVSPAGSCPLSPQPRGGRAVVQAASVPAALSSSAPPAPSSSCRRRTCRAT